MGKDNDLEWLDDTGSSAWERTDLNAIDNVAEQKKNEFLKRVIDTATSYNLVDTGTLTSRDGYRIDVVNKNGVTTLEIFMIFYGLFQDRGVKGFRSDKKSPDSPYSFKKPGISEEGRERLRASLESGRLKVSDTSTAAKYPKIGLETRADRDTGDPIDKQVDRLSYIISAFGITTRPFFKEAFEDTFGERLKYELLKKVNTGFIAKLKQLNKQ